jgi:hypothetical protein
MIENERRPRHAIGRRRPGKRYMALHVVIDDDIKPLHTELVQAMQ